MFKIQIFMCHKLSKSWLSNGKSCKIYSFIICTFHRLISCIENTFNTWIYKKMQNSYDICSFLGLYFIRPHIYLCIKCVFNAWYSSAKCMNLWMNKLHMIFIINLLNVKFVMWTNDFVSFNPLGWRGCPNLSISMQDHVFGLNANETTFSCIGTNVCIDLSNPP